MPDFPPECGSNRIASYRQTASRFGSMNRSGEIMDTLVFLIAGMLIPAWLLGHLFLTIYPAPKGDDSVVATGSEFGDEKSPDDSVSGEISNDGTTGQPGPDTPDPQLSALTGKSTLLQTEVDSLTSDNSQLKAEVERLKTAAASMPAGSQDQADTTAINELQSKLDAKTFELNSAKQSLAKAEEQTKNYEQENQQLSTTLSDLQLKLEQAKADLASARQAMDNEDESEIKTESPFAALPMENSTANANLLAESKTKVIELSAKVKELSFKLDSNNKTLSQRDEEIRSANLALEEVRVQNENLKTALELAKQNAAAAMASSRAPSPLPLADSSEDPSPSNNGLTLMPREEYRDFVSSKGSISKMAFIRWEGEDIIVRSFSNKRLYRLTLDRFSAADQQYLLDRKK